jgi:hypothetical protein
MKGQAIALDPPRKSRQVRLVGSPTPFRKGALGNRMEGTTHTAGMNPAYLVTSPNFK